MSDNYRDGWHAIYNKLAESLTEEDQVHWVAYFLKEARATDAVLDGLRGEIRKLEKTYAREEVWRLLQAIADRHHDGDPLDLYDWHLLLADEHLTRVLGKQKARGILGGALKKNGSRAGRRRTADGTLLDGLRRLVSTQLADAKKKVSEREPLANGTKTAVGLAREKARIAIDQMDRAFGLQGDPEGPLAPLSEDEHPSLQLVARPPSGFFFDEESGELSIFTPIEEPPKEQT